jgi:hypothetical protein
LPQNTQSIPGHEQADQPPVIKPKLKKKDEPFYEDFEKTKKLTN